MHACKLLTLSFNFLCAAGPNNSPGLQFYLKSPSFWPLGLLRVIQSQYSAQLQVSVQVVHLCVVHPRKGSVGKEGRGPSHVHFPCLLFVSSQNNLLSPGLDRVTYSRRRRSRNPFNNSSSLRASMLSAHCNKFDSTTRKMTYALNNKRNCGMHFLYICIPAEMIRKQDVFTIQNGFYLHIFKS